MKAPLTVEPRFARINEVTCPIQIGIGRAEADITGADFIEVAVGPAHGSLDGQLQPVKPDVERYLDATQDRGLTSSSVILSRAIMTALMPLLYNAPS